MVNGSSDNNQHTETKKEGNKSLKNHEIPFLFITETTDIKQ